VLTKDIDSDACGTATACEKPPKLRHIARVRQVPIHMIKDSTILKLPQLTKAVDIDETGIADERELSLFAQSGSEDEIDAPRRSQTLPEQIVIPKGQPVELLPRLLKCGKCNTS